MLQLYFRHFLVILMHKILPFSPWLNTHSTFCWNLDHFQPNSHESIWYPYGKSDHLASATKKQPDRISAFCAFSTLSGTIVPPWYRASLMSIQLQREQVNTLNLARFVIPDNFYALSLSQLSCFPFGWFCAFPTEFPSRSSGCSSFPLMPFTNASISKWQMLSP